MKLAVIKFLVGGTAVFCHGKNLEVSLRPYRQSF